MKIYSIGEAARILGVKPFRLAYAHTNGSLDEPARIMSRRAYSESDIERAASYFNVTPDFERDTKKEAKCLT